MSTLSLWWPWAATTTLLLLYTVYYALLSRGAAWRTHGRLRDDWLHAMSAQVGTEILAVQTLRNSVMTATMTASTAALGLMGALGLAAPALRAASAEGVSPGLSAALAGELTVLLLLVTTLVSTTLSIRFYHHAGFVCAMPVGSPLRARWMDTGRQHLRRAGVLYSIGLRSLVWVTPFLAGIVWPAGGVVVAILVFSALHLADRS
ncbi:DUF599 family protein [Rhodoferax mekongensis]|uniref:DUF599 family protein n=1 Tax=Rhodoferax mekongensis TaxID=3068341 RepID=A0ABZ0B2P8_9BURK|nr:DUF599 family protein [Rhodoferax sp. TBRC 17307]WNO05329.1 DUF599 family protein [Rhodoferax sp. TBRC 17307]